ncbi:helix-turn-helix transcriptional regulator [Pseudomonas abietaniphila]|jgi:LuxR family transcriptional regulator|uniref:helix-turn-helix transcriptional regulator n=1 Tax=Pseudomonas abietaniphila TaxID=89065 RepID=UPI0007811B06|nr:LuxR family transcriptional regulator [Pseudomonas abietaniphila]
MKNVQTGTLSPLIQQMVSSITEQDGDAAIANALDWLREECGCERAMLYQYRNGSLLSCITSNVDNYWKDLYCQGRLMIEDPVIRCFRRAMGFLDWEEAFQTYPPSPAYMAAVEDCQLLPAFSYGYSSQNRANQGVVTICSLNAMSRPLTHNDRYLLTSLVPMLHVAGKGRQLQTRALTPKELEILKWAREGKTAWEIGLIKEVSEATVKHHFKSIYAKLGVTNRAQAVGEALCRGIIQ